MNYYKLSNICLQFLQIKKYYQQLYIIIFKYYQTYTLHINDKWINNDILILLVTFIYFLKYDSIKK